MEKLARGEIQSALDKEVMELTEVNEVDEPRVTQKQRRTGYIDGS
jgi:hypothetical protein